MILHSEERTLLVIDGPALFRTMKALDFEIDFKRLLAYFRERTRFVRAMYYTGVYIDGAQSSLRPLIDWLDYNGFTMVTKVARDHAGSEDYERPGVDLHVEMAVDAMDMSGFADHIVFFTGDENFTHLIAALQRRGKRVSVVSSLVPGMQLISKSLRRQADQFVDIEDLRPHIAREANQVHSPVSSPEPVDTDERSTSKEMGSAFEAAGSDNSDSGGGAIGRTRVIVEKRRSRARPKKTE